MQTEGDAPGGGEFVHASALDEQDTVPARLLCVLDRDTTVRISTPTVDRLVGGGQSLLGRRLRDLTVTDDAATLDDAVARVDDVTNPNALLRFARSGAAPVWLSCTLSQASDGKVGMIAADVSHLVEGGADTAADSQARADAPEVVSDRGGLEAVLDSLAVCCWVTDASLRFESVWGSEILGSSRQTPDSLRRLVVLLPPVDASRAERAIDELTQGRPARFMLRRGERSYECRLEPHLDNEGALVGSSGIAVDVSDSRKEESELARQAELLRGMAATANTLLVTEDLDEAIDETVATVGQVTGSSAAFVFVRETNPDTGRSAVRARSMWHLSSDPPGGDFGNIALDHPSVQPARRALEQGRVAESVIEDPKSLETFGDREPIRLIQVPIFAEHKLWGVLALATKDADRHLSDSEMSMLVAVAADIGAAVARHQAAHLVRHRAYHDQLTGLPNRQLLLDRVGQAMQLARRTDQLMALLLVDLDRFKLVNDSLGSAVGDELLLGVRDRISRAAREGDTVARIGGDEFAVLIPTVTRLEDVVRIAQDVLALAADPFRIRGRDLYANVSAGIAVFPYDGDDAEELMRNAAAAQQRAKNQGGGAYQLYSSEMNAAAFESLVLENSLRAAVGGREISVYYQPLVDLSAGGVDGFEALVRWMHPHSGMVLPSEFIPMAETTGLVVPLGEQVLRGACRDIAALSDGLPDSAAGIRLAINLSPRQFMAPGLVEVIAEALVDSGFDGASLELELTESVFLDDVDASASTLRRLKAMGVRVVIDDFGVGYSSLGYLKNLPVDGLKIDRMFVRDVTADAAAAAIATTIIDLAHSLGMEVTAEGVETRAELDFFVARGCDRTQGFLFSGPQPAQMLPHLIRSVHI